ncbi:class I SAM-dependent methyltransferase [Bremerella sp. JC770]|uniref:class I SAM-dependent methyltransferase n=1 Tax=Bremerella sp. JC770 TaxID=3232137 RepID=UPI0034598D1D
MDPQDLNDYVTRYEAMLREHGPTHRALGWGENGRQDLRFSVLSEPAIAMGNPSVLDVGCGFGDLYHYLKRRGWEGNYVGVDIVEQLLTVARQRHPEVEFIERDITAEGAELGTFDFVIASGIANARLPSGDNQGHIVRLLNSMRKHARVAVCMDFLSTFVDFQRPESWHTDPHWILDISRSISRRVTLRMDYMPFEYSVILWCDDAIHDRNVFPPRPSL